MCHRLNEQRALRCDCRYKFGQSVDKVIDLLHRQRRQGWVVLGTALLADAGSIFLLTTGSLRAIWLAAGSFLWTGRVIRKLLITRVSLRQLESRKLPEARLLQD